MNKIEHKISWEVNTIVPAPVNWIDRLIQKLGHTKSEVHTYILDVEVSASDGDSTDSALDSIMRQLKNISVHEEHKIKAHNGIKRTQYFRNDLI